MRFDAALRASGVSGAASPPRERDDPRPVRLGGGQDGSPASVRPKDTIFALSSGRLPAAIAVVRLSGPQAGPAVEALTIAVPAPRQAALRTLRDPASGEALDQGLVLWFPGPASETGEDVAELQLHGSSAVVAAVFRVLGALPGLRPAEAGEFTRRAFENGRIDLTRVEALADLVAAGTEAQRRQALGQLQGLLGERASKWRETLIGAMAQVEAGLDFADEGDVPGSTGARGRAAVQQLRREVEDVLADRRGERIREGIVVAVTGPPNAGKSSLLNRLAGRDAALVSPIAGTTRDVIEVHLELAGIPVTLLDTAGMRPTDDPVERAGVLRALERARSADLVLWVEDVTSAPAEPAEVAGDAPVWRVLNKLDLFDSERKRPRGARVAVSALTGVGFRELADAIGEFAARVLRPGEPALITRARHRFVLNDVAAALDRALLDPTLPEELFAEELRSAAAGLGRLLGRIDVEDVLGAIFADFCIGK